MGGGVTREERVRSGCYPGPVTFSAGGRRVDPLLLVVAFVTALLLGLGFLQYRWTGELSEAERGRLRAGLRMRAELLAQDLDREVTRAFFRLQLEPAALRDRDFTSYAERYDRWRTLAAEPGLVKEVYLAESGRAGDPLRLLRYAPEQRTFTPVEWPANLAAARDRALGEASPERPPRGFRPGPLNLLDDGTPVFVAPAPAFDRGPVAGRGPQGGGEPMGVFAFRLAGFTLIVLDQATLTEKLLPTLERRYFPVGEDPGFALRVTRQDRPGDVLYTSPGADTVRVQAEAAVGMLELRFDEALEDDVRAMPPPWGGAERRPGGDRMGFGERRPPGERPLVGFGGRPPRGRGREGRTGLWMLEVAHRGGSVDELVAGARRRNLLVGFTVLLLLGTTTLLLALAARRAERLAARQMEFVAAVSHELRTPVSVICSAGENLADGVVQGQEGVARYGTLVRDEGRRLGRLVEQVLDFAGTYSGHRPYRREPVEVARLVDDALDAAKAALDEAGVRAIREVAADLPPLRGDGSALARALRNLVENAVKYGGEDRQVVVRARRVEHAGQPWVRLEVEDHGLGIAPGEQKHLFEPFWRGTEAAGIRGSGLGLALVKSIVTAHAGQVSVRSEPGRGSVFALELPAAHKAEATSGAREENHDDIPHIAG